MNRMKISLLSLFTCLLYLICGDAFAQNAKPVIFTADSDTTSYGRMDSQIKRFSLWDMDTAIYYSRISSLKYFLEFTTTKGRLSMAANETSQYGQTGDCFVKVFELDSLQLSQVLDLYSLLNIDVIPTDKFIAEWKWGFDGIIYTFESRRDTLYSLKHYWTPEIQENETAHKLDSFFKRLDRIVDYPEKQKIMNQEVPFQMWSMDGSIVGVSRGVNSRRAYRKYTKDMKARMKGKGGNHGYR